MRPSDVKPKQIEGTLTLNFKSFAFAGLDNSRSLRSGIVIRFCSGTAGEGKTIRFAQSDSLGANMLSPRL